MNYCSHCGSSKLEFVIPKGDQFARFVCPNCQTIHYQNPNMVVGAIPVWKNKVLLAKRNIEPRKGFWNLPCGFLEMNETVEEGAIREVFEETGSKIDLIKLHTVYNLPDANQVYLIFVATMQNDIFNPTSESSEVKLFSEHEIPWEEIAFSSNTFALTHFFDDLKTGNSKVNFGTFKKSKPFS